MKILVTGSAGFIGFHLIKALLKQKFEVVGIDNLNDYYSPQLKLDRLSELERYSNETNNVDRYKFYQIDISNSEDLEHLFKENKFDRVIHLAAQAGVRYSLENPKAYIASNIVGFANILEGCRQQQTAHLIYASSSSVYGMNKKIPFSTDDRVDFPISLYAATKKSNELMAHTYSHLFGIPTTGLRFFTVYGPWGRPDMAYFSFTQKIIKGDPINIFNNGNMKRDFTYIDDIIEGIVRLINHIPTSRSNSTSTAEAPYSIYNIGNNHPISLERFITAIELAVGKKAVKINKPMQPGDVPITYADVNSLMNDVGFKPATDIETGIKNFVTWYKEREITF